MKNVFRTMPKKMSDTTPMKGLPSRPLHNSGFRPPRVSLPNRQTSKKEGGVKLLDITEQPMGYTAAKKRKRQQDIEDAKKAAEEATAAAQIKSENINPNPTPDYAANLAGSLHQSAVPPPAYVPPTPQAPAAPPPVYAPIPSVTLPLATPQNALPGAPVTINLPTTPLPQITAGTRLVQLPTQPLPQVRMAGIQGNFNSINLNQGLVTGLNQNITATRTVVQPQHIIMQQPRQTFLQAQPHQQILRQVLYLYIYTLFVCLSVCIHKRQNGSLPLIVG